MKLDLNLERTFPHPVERVWEAISTADNIAAWLFTCDFKPEVGHKFTFKTTPPEGSTWRGWTDIEVLEFAPPTRMVWAWESADIDEPTRVIFQLDPVDGGTRLSLSHVGDSTADDIASVSGGWPVKLDALVEFIGD
jgi:uncharacterized protein YndB with AHSA1/START domain